MDSIITYEGEYYRSHYGHLLDEDYYRRLARFNRFNWFAGIDLDVDTSVFEVGIGLGVNVAWSDRANGFDVSRYAREFCRGKGIRVFDSMEDVPDEHYDVVLSCHSLEHVDEPLNCVKEMKRICKRGGLLVVIVPWELHQISTFEPDDNGHLYCWTFRTLNNLLLKCGGLEIESNRYLWGPIGIKRLTSLERMFGSEFYFGVVQLLGRYKNNYRSLRVVARRTC